MTANEDKFRNEMKSSSEMNLLKSNKKSAIIPNKLMLCIQIASVLLIIQSDEVKACNIMAHLYPVYLAKDIHFALILVFDCRQLPFCATNFFFAAPIMILLQKQTFAINQLLR